jgi:hypothetical protein
VVHSIFGGKVSIESKRERKLLKRACLNVDSIDALSFSVYIHVVQDGNQGADALSKIGSSWAQNPQGVFVQDIHTPSVRTDLVNKPPTRHCS